MKKPDGEMILPAGEIKKPASETISLASEIKKPTGEMILLTGEIVFGRAKSGKTKRFTGKLYNKQQAVYGFHI